MDDGLKGRPLLYSTGTDLAYRIAKKYYNDIHYVWCTTSFDASLQPGTSNPRTLCNRYLDQIIRGDNHAFEIENNKAGILRGAKHKLDTNIINRRQFREIRTIVNCAEMKDFSPVIFLIHKISAKNRSIKVPQEEAANDVSVEYRIIDLQRDEFELIRLKTILGGIVRPY